MPRLRRWRAQGFNRAGTGKRFAKFEIQSRAEMAITADVKGAVAAMKSRFALYAGETGLARATQTL
jgi:hypothetical protein